jgi:hypothetical protein
MFPPMCKRLLKSILIAVTLSVGVQGQIVAAPPFSVMCETDAVPAPFGIVVSQFGSMREAVHHCLTFWNGHPHGVEKID